MKVCDSTLSRVVFRRMSLPVTGDMSINCIVNIGSAGTGMCLGAPPTGRRLRVSAWGMLWPGLWTIWYSYPASVNAQRCIRGYNICGTALFLRTIPEVALNCDDSKLATPQVLVNFLQSIDFSPCSFSQPVRHFWSGTHLVSLYQLPWA